MIETREYLVVIEQGEKSWGAYVPDLPGCVAVGETYEETEKLIREAIPFHIRGLISDGDSVPKPTAKAVRITVAT